MKKINTNAQKAYYYRRKERNKKNLGDSIQHKLKAVFIIESKMVIWEGQTRLFTQKFFLNTVLIGNSLQNIMDFTCEQISCPRSILLINFFNKL